MYIKHIALRNVRGFSQVNMTLPDAKADGNWIVLLGENGAGKSTILRAIALALSTQRMASRLLDRPREWLRQPDRDAQCDVTLCSSAWDDDPGFPPAHLAYRIGPNWNQRSTGAEIVVEYLDNDSLEVRLAMKRLYNGVLAGYGAYRRPVSAFRSRGESGEEMFTTLFDDGVGIVNLEDWLRDRDYRAAKTRSDGWHAMLELVLEVVRELMPDGQRYNIEIEPDNIVFTRTGAPRIPLSSMGEGYRVMFALAVDIFRQLTLAGGWDNLKTPEEARQKVRETSGVVLIDEVDAHLHPKWQREIGFYFQRIFPKVQFIVSTHSPFVAQAASPGGVLVLKQTVAGTVELDDSLTNLRGISATDILQSRAFDLDSVRDPETDAIMKEHAELSALRDVSKLSPAKRRRLEELQALLRARELPTEPETEEQAELDRMIREVRERHD